MNDGYILLHRKILKWEWYSNINDRLVFIHCLLSANWEDGWFEGIKIPRGSFATSYKNLSKEIGISVHQLRTSLNHLKLTHNVAHETNKQFSIITINNYDKYQVSGTPSGKRVANEWQTSGNNIINNNKEINKENISKDILKKVFVKPTLEEIKDYCESRDNDVDYKKFYDYYETNDWKDKDGKKIKNWKQKVITWEGRKKEKTLPNWFNNEPKRKEINDERKKLAEQLTNGTYKP